MDKQEMIKKLERIIDYGISEHHDREVLREALKIVKMSDFKCLLRMLNHCKNMIGHYSVHEDDGTYDISITDNDQTVVLIFDAEGNLIA